MEFPEPRNDKCDPGVCSKIPGLVYNAELDECAWPDEVGCTLQDLGLNSVCDVPAYDLKSADFSVPLPEGRTQDQYFIVCVPMTTEEDRRARSLAPTGPVVPRLVGCPGEQVFDANTKMCQ